MRPLLVLTAAVAAAATLATQAGLASPRVTVRHYAWHAMTLDQRIAAQQRLVVADWRIITLWRSRQTRLRELDATASWSRVSAQLPPEPYAVHWHYLHLKWTQRELKQSLAAKQRLERSLATTGPWACIHSREGSWTDPNGPYYGGLQEDLGFQQSYGPEFLAAFGTADHWPVQDQILAAERARDGWYNPVLHERFGARGYGPWPNTARACGLLH